MNTTIYTYESRNNTYHLVKSAKTTYEQQQEARAERNYMILQKSAGIAVMTLSIIPAIMLNEPRILLLTGIFALLGLLVTLTNEHVIG